MKTAIWKCVASVLMVLLSACAGTTEVKNAERNIAMPAPDSSSSSKSYEDLAEYRLGAQDLLQITVLGVPDLDREVRVNSNGQISLPLIGGVLAGGKTIPELEEEIADKLVQTYLQDPQVSVFIKEYTSQRVTMDGALNKPGIYSLTGTTTLLQAVALAGGLDPLAQRDGVIIFRQVDGKKMAAVFDLTKITGGVVDDPQVFGDDIIVVARSGSRSTFQELIKSAPLLALFFLL